MPTTPQPPFPFDTALKAALAQIASDKRGQATVLATTQGLEAQVAWRVAPWWTITGVVQRPWGAPFQGAIKTTFSW